MSCEADVRIDIVFSDVNMPGSMDGFGLAQWVRRERPWLQVILTSGAARTAKEAGDLCEQGPILAKPYDHAELERHIRTCWRASVRRVLHATLPPQRLTLRSGPKGRVSKGGPQTRPCPPFETRASRLLRVRS